MKSVPKNLLTAAFCLLMPLIAIQVNAGITKTPVNQTDSEKVKPNRIIIQFSETALPYQIQTALDKIGGKLHYQSRLVSGLQVVEFQNHTMVSTAIELLNALPIIDYIETDQPISIGSDASDPLFALQYALQNTGQNIQGVNGRNGEDIGFLETVNNSKLITPNASPVLVAIIDTGIDLDHPDLVDNIWVNTGEIPNDGIDNDGNGYIDDIRGINIVGGNNNPDDDNGHGTHCASITGSVNNNLGVASVAGDFVKLMPIKILNANGSGLLSDAIEAVEYAYANGAMISNNSYGGLSEISGLNEVIKAATGHLFVTAAGNNSSNIDSTRLLGLISNGHYPAANDAENILSVASLDNNGEMSAFSNYGSNSVDISAYGANILAAYNDGNYAYLSGTSMSSPLVAGIAAHIKYHLNLSNIQLKKAIMKGGVNNPASDGKTVSGNRADLAQTYEYLFGDYEPSESTHEKPPQANGNLLGGGLFGSHLLFGPAEN